MSPTIIHLPSPVAGHGFAFGAWLFKQQDRQDGIGALARALHSRLVKFRWTQGERHLSFELVVPADVFCDFSLPDHAKYVVRFAWLEFQTTMLLFASSDFFAVAIAALNARDGFDRALFKDWPRFSLTAAGRRQA
jgi:hypothetical protein